MLPFGSLFSQLPLLLIGVLYMLYLGLSAVNKERAVLSKETIQPEPQIIEACNAVDYFILSETSFHSPADKPESPCVVPSDYFVQSFVFLDNDFPISSFYDVHILSRPPPQL